MTSLFKSQRDRWFILWAEFLFIIPVILLGKRRIKRTHIKAITLCLYVCLPAYLSLRPIAHPPAVSIGRPIARLWSNRYQRFCQVAVFIRIDIISLYFYKGVNGAPRNIRNVTMKDCICKVCDKLARTRVSLFSRERGWYHRARARACVRVCVRERESMWKHLAALQLSSEVTDRIFYTKLWYFCIHNSRIETAVS